jgi:hypothetical protein
VARELHLLRVLVRAAPVTVARELVHRVRVVPLVAPVPPAVLVLPVPLVHSDLVVLVVDPVVLVVLVVDPVVLVAVVPVAAVVPVVALAQVVDVVLRAAVVVVADVVRMIYSRQ